MISCKNRQIVHESESQRQHVRLKIPARAVIGDQKYDVRDLSPGGLQLAGINHDGKAGQRIGIRLILPFENFSMTLDLEGEIEHRDPKKRIMGCRFVKLAPAQVSLLNYVLKSFMAGQMVVEGDLLNVAARNNFTPLRIDRQDNNLPKTGIEIAKRILLAIFLSLCGLAALVFIIFNIAERIRIVKSYEGIVKGENITVRASADGLFRSLLDENVQHVSLGQPIAEIHGTVIVPVLPFSGAAAEGQANEAAYGAHRRIETVRSPCDCVIAYRHVQSGEFRAMGDPLFKLVPESVAPWVLATVSMAEAQRIGMDDKVTLHIAGEAGPVTGRITDIDYRDDDRPVTVIRVQPERVLPRRLINRPVYSEFLVY